MKRVRVAAFTLLVLMTVGAALLTYAWLTGVPVFIYDFNTEVSRELPPETLTYMSQASSALARLVITPLAITTGLWIIAFVVLWRSKQTD